MPFEPQPSAGLSPGRTTKRFGTGLGIPVAYKVCKAHGWKLQFGKGEQGGTRVTITAPLYTEDEESEKSDG
jgi:signal transduction histidine kinase